MAKKMKINVRDIAELVELYNPFGFKDAKGRIMVFRTYEDAYSELLMRIYKAGPIMVDAVLFCSEQLGMTLSESKKFVALWRGYCGVADPQFLFDWQHGGKDRDMKLEQFARGMHLLSETKLNKDMFLSALNRFKQSINCKD